MLVGFVERSANWVGVGWKSLQLPELRGAPRLPRPDGRVPSSSCPHAESRARGPCHPDGRLEISVGAELSRGEGSTYRTGEGTYGNGLGARKGKEEDAIFIPSPW